MTALYDTIIETQMGPADGLTPEKAKQVSSAQKRKLKVLMSQVQDLQSKIRELTQQNNQAAKAGTTGPTAAKPN